ncbi:MAG: DUF6807 family protein [Anditalea sp.]
MNKLVIVFLLFSIGSCQSPPSVEISEIEEKLIKSGAPFNFTPDLEGKYKDAAMGGTLNLLAKQDGGEDFVIPVQWDISHDESNFRAIAVYAGDGTHTLSEMKWYITEDQNEDNLKADKNPKGQIEITENGNHVLRYNYETVYEHDELNLLPANEYIVTEEDTFMVNPSIYAVPRSNYIHPLYGLNGEILTRDWAKDHPHHRGIYWAWPEVIFGDQMGDLHALQKVFARPTGKISYKGGPVFAEIKAENLWIWEEGIVPIVREHVTIQSYKSNNQGRVIDFKVKMEALKEDISIARRGTEGYGGLNIRMMTPDSQEISVHNGDLENQPARSWSVLDGKFKESDDLSGLVILQNAQNPHYPGDWVQFPELSWSQPTFPASGKRHKLIPGEPLTLNFRFYVHSNEKLEEGDLSYLWDAYHSQISPL